MFFTFINTAQDDMEQASVHNTAFIYMLCSSPLSPKLFFLNTKEQRSSRII